MRRSSSFNPRVQLARRPLATWLITSRSHACAGWLSSRRSQIMAASIGLGERDNRWKTRGETLSWFWRRSAEAPIPGPMSPESPPLTRTARASLVLRQAWIFRDRPQQNRVQIEQTRFPAGAELPASPSRIPVLSLPGDPCGARRRIDLAATACGKIARPGKPVAAPTQSCHLYGRVKAGSTTLHGANGWHETARDQTTRRSGEIS